MYRNHFCAGADDASICRELIALGYMQQFERSYLSYFNCIVTDAGKEAVLRESPSPPIDDGPWMVDEIEEDFL
jgi:hypothetical protein